MKFLVLADIHDTWTYYDKMVELAESTDGVVFLGDLMILKKVSSLSLEKFELLRDAANWMVAVPGNGPLPEVVEFLTNLRINIHGSSSRIEDIGFFGVGGVSNSVDLILELRRYFIQEKPKPIELAPRSLETLAFFGIHLRDGAFEVDEWNSKKIKEMEALRSPFEHTEDEIFSLLMKGYQEIAKLDIRILISHIPPYVDGLNSKLPEGISTGSRAITRFLRTQDVSYVLSGHYHLYHEFMIDSVPCVVVPAVVDGYYSILSVNPTSGAIDVTVNKF